jgi:hypothetical protein
MFALKMHCLWISQLQDLSSSQICWNMQTLLHTINLFEMVAMSIDDTAKRFYVHKVPGIYCPVL